MASRLEYSNEVALRSLATKSGLTLDQVARMAERNQLHLAVARVNSSGGRTRKYAARAGGHGTMRGRVALAVAQALDKAPWLS